MRSLRQMGFSKKVQWVEITPDLAKEIIRDHTVINQFGKDENNRDMKAHNVKIYRYYMENGLWDETEAMILFDKNGNLINGQNRLTALSQQHNSFYFCVGTDFEHSMFMDMPIKRTVMDNMKILHIVDDTLHNTQIKNIISTMMYIKLKSGKPFPNEVMETFIHYEKELKEFKPVTSKRFRAPVYAALFVAYVNGVSLDNISDFVNVLHCGIARQDKDMPIIALRDKLMATKSSAGGGSAVSNDIFGRTQYALHAWNSGKAGKKSMNKIYYNYDLTFLNTSADRYN